MSRKNKIYCSLNGNGISDKDYQHVLEVWNKFEMKTTKDYRDLHLQCDVLMLADGFDQFRNRCGKNLVCVLAIIWAHQLYVGMQCLVWLK